MRVFRLLENNDINTDIMYIFTETKNCLSTIIYDISEFIMFIYYCICVFCMFIMNCFKYIDNGENILYKRAAVFIFMIILQYVLTFVTPINIIYVNNQIVNSSKNLNDYIYLKIFSNTIAE